MSRKKTQELGAYAEPQVVVEPAEVELVGMEVKLVEADIEPTDAELREIDMEMIPEKTTEVLVSDQIDPLGITAQLEDTLAKTQIRMAEIEKLSSEGSMADRVKLVTEYLNLEKEIQITKLELEQYGFSLEKQSVIDAIRAVKSVRITRLVFTQPEPYMKDGMRYIPSPVITINEDTDTSVTAVKKRSSSNSPRSSNGSGKSFLWTDGTYVLTSKDLLKHKVSPEVLQLIPRSLRTVAPGRGVEALKLKGYLPAWNKTS